LLHLFVQLALIQNVGKPAFCEGPCRSPSFICF